MNEKPLDLTKPMQTRSGWEATLICSDLSGDNPLGFRIKRPDGTEHVTNRRIDGRCFHIESEFDIINVPTKIVSYVNAYSDGTGYMYPSSTEADRAAGSGCIARLRIEFTEGQFDD